MFNTNNGSLNNQDLSKATSAIDTYRASDKLDLGGKQFFGRSSNNLNYVGLQHEVSSDILQNDLNYLSKTSANSIVFIDSSVPDYESLANGINSGAKVYVLDSKRDGIEQISKVLAQHKDVSGIHIVSHGFDGGLQLGKTTVDSSNIERYRKQLGQWSSHLTKNADILLYGCNVAQTQAGASFVEKLSQLTSTDVAASSDLTGTASLGGNWVLEFNTGDIETASPWKHTTAYSYTFQGGDGLKGEYFDNRDFTNLKLTRVDSTVNFNWRNNAPDVSMGRDTFSVRWTGQVMARYNETYNFHTTSDDGVRLWVNNQLIIDKFVNQVATEWTGNIALEAGQRYDIRLEYYDNSGEAVSRLAWSSASQVKEFIPQSQLFSEATSNEGPPVARLNATNLTNGGGETYTFSVTYSDNTAISIASLDDNDIVVTGPDGTTREAAFIGVNSNIDGNPRTAIYAVTGAGGTWDATDNGNYTISLQGNQVSDTSGNFAEAKTLGNFQVNIAGTGTGLAAEYFDNMNFTNLKVSRTDATVNFNWGKNSPDSRIAIDTFSARWTGQVEAKFTERYNFFTTTDDGVRLWVNDQLLIDKLNDQAAIEWNGSIDLQAGQKYNIKLEYFENKGDALSRLSWSSASQLKEIIPQSQLYSTQSLVPAIALGTPPGSVNETDGTVTIIVVRSGEDLSGTSTVLYSTQNDGPPTGAIAGDDYVQTSGTLTFAPGETSKTVTISLIDDNLLEGLETFTFVVDQAEGATLGTQRTAKITINDDEANDLSFSVPTVSEKDGNAMVTVRRSNTNGAASVDYTTVDGTAVSGSDYQAISGTLEFASGESIKTISIPLVNDTAPEVNEKFTLQFSNPVNAGLNAQDKIEISVLDDDAGSFIRERVVGGLRQPTAFEWTPDGSKMFIAQKNGIVRIFENGALLNTPFIDISSQVNDVRDRGLIGIAVHPDFANNPYIYLSFTYDPPEVYLPENINNPNTLSGPDETGNRPSRLIRVTADFSTNYTTAIAGSEVVLLGKNSIWQNISRPDLNSTGNSNILPSGIIFDSNGNQIGNVQDYLATDSESHSIGDAVFGTDGMLYVSNGDGTSYNRIDRRGYRVQDLDNLSGKLLRIDPMTGQGLADNPFFDGNSDSNRSKVYNYGLRNPFRFTVDKATNTPYIGDVGWSTWEEINSGRGKNFGWPHYEGGSNGTSQKTRGYMNQPESEAFYATASPVEAPIYAYQHTTGNYFAILMGDFYTGNTYPSIYQNNLFVGDVAQGTVDALTLNSDGKVVSVRRFDSNVPQPTQLMNGPDGNVYYASLSKGEIGRWRYTTQS
ncbi:MAG: DUF4347 domain-containing protein [Calothrix sp. FI2-JRJ7]|jgi:glucose/arabinose dehydrogenase|nr:DUF4347 domain-containing protein [Calothrix sp. FI2-JRJ7]